MKYEEEKEKIKKYNKKLINSVNYFIISLLKKKKKKRSWQSFIFWVCFQLFFMSPYSNSIKLKAHFSCSWAH